jgi:hypothetical protein
MILEQGRQNWTSRTGQAKLDNQNWTGPNRTGRTGQANRTGRTALAEQECLGRTALAEQECQDRTVKTGLPGQG